MKVVAIIAILPAIATCVCLLGRPPESAVHTASNQHLFSAVPASSEPATDNVTPTWSRDVAPILYKNCTTCHHPGGGGPFSLLTYEDARRRGPQLAQVTASRFMPPWLPEHGYGDFADQRRLSTEEITLIQKWVSTGMPRGDAAETPQIPQYDTTWT